jgi:hypothetical protein
VSNEDLVKIVIGLASAFAGWLLAQITSALKTWAQRRKVKNLLLEELADLKREVERVMGFYWRELQLTGAQGIGNGVTSPISNPIFKNYYKDALLGLNQDQRISYQMIHSLVDALNNELAELRKFTSEIQQEHHQTGVTERIVKLGVAWGDKIKAGHHNCAVLRWHIRFHLDHPNGPDLSPNTPTHEGYLKYLEQAEAEAERLIQSGKEIPREKFEKVYDPEAFSRTP